MIPKFSRLTSSLFTLVVGFLIMTASASSQTLTITAGQGQVVAPSSITPQNLTVQLLGPTGLPMSGQPVVFTLVTSAYVVSPGSLLSTGGVITDPLTGLSSPVSYTDQNGMAYVQFIGALPGALAGYVPATITATTNGLAVIFYETTTAQVGGGGNSVSSQILSGSAGFLNGQAGTVSASPIQVQVTSLFGSSGGGVANVSFTITTDPGSTGTVSCKEGPFVLTNAFGVATCTPLFGKVGSGTFTINVGNYNTFLNNSFTVTVGPPALIQITSGNNQSGIPGALLPLPIVAMVTDLGGNPVPNVSMVFTSITPGGATFTNLRTMTDTAGKVSASVYLGNVPGAIQISLTDTQGLINPPTIFTETVNLTITGLQKNSGDGQSTIVNTAFASPLVVTLATSAGQTVGSLPVTFSVVSGSGTVSSPIATTNAQGQASTTVVAGAVAGPLVIAATSGGFSVQFNLTVAPPGPTNLTFTNAASGVGNSLSPGSLVTIYGGSLATNVQGVVGSVDVGPHPYTVAGVSVLFGNVPAPIFDLGNISGSQFVTVQVPFGVAAGSTIVTINITGGGTASIPVTLTPASPGLFEYVAADNAKHLVALRPDGSVVSPSNPTVRGESVRFYATGLGPLTPSIATNGFSPAASDPAVAGTLILGLANQGAAFTQAIYARGMVGIEEITFVVPATVASGPVQVSIGLQVAGGNVYYSQGSILNVQ